MTSTKLMQYVYTRHYFASEIYNEIEIIDKN